MNVFDQFLRVGVFLHRVRFETSLEQVSASLMTTIEADAVRRLQPSCRGAEIRSRRLKQQAIVVGHQAVGMDHHPNRSVVCSRIVIYRSRSASSR